MNQQDLINQEVPLEQELPTELPEVIPNSTLQLDGDISCYYSAWLDMPLGACINQLKKHIEMKRILAGCEIVNVHTTHGDKAGRAEIAQVNKYQDERGKHKDPDQQERVKALKQFLQTYETQTVKPCPQFKVEADDSMNIYQRIEIELGNFSAICTKDKDLDMCPGNHFTYDDMELFEVPNGYGRIDKTVTKVEDPKTKSGFRNKTKISGVGTSWFWCQLLQGDKADSIPGLPAITGKLLNKYKPTLAILKAQKVLSNPSARLQAKEQAQTTITTRKSQPLGAVTAYEMLKQCRSDKEAFKIVSKAYKEYYGKDLFTFESWRGEVLPEMSSGTMLLEQARLLWMLRTWNDDVIKFFIEVATCTTQNQ